ncbi:SGNH/GDSL hydrolase family protein [Rubrivivax rivuli]|uniref:SGNH/GDSL hydrolase family protein n=1 Tax=Rubrivivax rivuli TaxID=1862385 RepID=A0A437RKH3_9BURK|nr:SGNH/GDSL hydrolase family protein [Rubrivivax rivuli]RVU47291.1 SGNH/GDSL hydrolase family protein [Rubrivivax rivuli]
MSLALKLALSPLLVAQAVLARRRLPVLPEPAGARQGVAGAASAAPLRLLITGDSSAAGVGVVHQRQALAVQLAQQAARLCAARVSWQLLAKSGLNTAQTRLLLQREGAGLQADVAVVVTGVNDVVEQVPSHHAVSAREALANALRNAHGVQHVVFAPLPPIHHFPGLPQPLRWVAGSDARRHNKALQQWVQQRGGDVSLVDMETPLNAGVMAADGFHPGEPVYRYCAAAIAEHIAAEVWPRLSVQAS